jgi:dephospho-CoA kinase
MKIGLTGGIGSGKSTVAKIFKELGVPVFNSDQCARDAESLPHIQEAFKRVLGDDIFVDGKVDRERMRGIIFVDKNKMEEINQIIIPHIKSEFKEFIGLQYISTPYVMLESAILFETGADKGFNAIVTVTADTDTRISRAMHRDGSSLVEVQNKLANQWDEIDKIKLTDYLVINDGKDLIDSLPILTKQVEIIHNSFLIQNQLLKLNDLFKNL